MKFTICSQIDLIKESDFQPPDRANLIGVAKRIRTSDLPLRRTVYTLFPDMAWSITTPQTRVITGFLSEHDVFSPLVFLLIFFENSYSD